MECKKFLFHERCNMENSLKQINLVSIITITKILLHKHSGHKHLPFTARSTTRLHINMLNIDVKITIMRCQGPTVITNGNVGNISSSITDIFGTRPTTDVKFLCVNRFHNISGRITKILTDTAVIWKC